MSIVAERKLLVQGEVIVPYLNWWQVRFVPQEWGLDVNGGLERPSTERVVIGPVMLPIWP